jgi:putative DNA primase/helicase
MMTWTDFAPGNHRLSCPACGRKPNDKTLGLTVDREGRGVAHCFRCSYVESHSPEHGVLHRPRKAIIQPVQATKHEILSDYWLELWSACNPLHGVALDYLTGRRCVIPPGDGALRCHPALKHPSGYVGAALVGLITDVHTNDPISLHRTWVNADGSKADVSPPRMLLAGHRKQGGAIRIWPNESVAKGLAVAEGIETALSLAHAYKPAWACVDAGNLAVLPVLAGIETLLIGVDYDPAGIKAANDCAARWSAAGVEVLLTQQAENDINDALLGAA